MLHNINKTFKSSFAAKSAEVKCSNGLGRIYLTTENKSVIESQGYFLSKSYKTISLIWSMHVYLLSNHIFLHLCSINLHGGGHFHEGAMVHLLVLVNSCFKLISRSHSSHIVRY